MKANELHYHWEKVFLTDLKCQTLKETLLIVDNSCKYSRYRLKIPLKLSDLYTILLLNLCATAWRIFCFIQGCNTSMKMICEIV